MPRTAYRIKFSYLSLLLFLFVLGCTSKEKITTSESNEQKSEQKLEKFSMVETVAGKKQWELEAAQALVFEKEKRTKLEKIKLKFYKEEKLTSILMAEKGDIDTETGNMQAQGNVLFTSVQEQVKVETEELNWDNKTKKIVTESFVKETRPDGIITGYGLEAEPDLSKSVIKREVKAQVLPKQEKNEP